MKKMQHLSFLLLFILIINNFCIADDGYRLWLRYDKITDAQKLGKYDAALSDIIVAGNSATIIAVKEELSIGLSGLLGRPIEIKDQPGEKSSLFVGTPNNSSVIASLKLNNELKNIGDEGYLLFTTLINNKKTIILTANADIGLLYGTFHFLRLIQTHQDISDLDITNSPKVQHRLLNHWDNLNRSVERGYAGSSIWQWKKLPDYISHRYKDYARANASIGINGTVLTNVNANALILTPEYLEKVAALANVFRPYGIKVYLTARFSAPIEIGDLKTADPLDSAVIEWWNKKVEEIYKYIPDFGGLLVKANSEGQPGPQDYKRTHAEGANLLATALEPHGGIVMWRAFVYSNEQPDDRAKQAYSEFVPLDGKFKKNVIIQVKNGAIDFQPREPFHPLFGSMPKTPLMMEFQVTQEYLGQGIHLVYLAPLYKECLESDTYAKGQGSTVAKVIDGTLLNYSQTAVAGVSNIGDDRNWCGHPMAQSNWYALGRLAWDPYVSAEEIANEWIRMTFSNDADVISIMQNIMMGSREACVNYMTPLGLHHQMAWNHHYGPGPWIKDKPRADWTSMYYSKASEDGIGFDRTKTGSNAVSQYITPVAAMYGNLESCPENLLLWFHHLPWNYKMKSENTLWNELCNKYYSGVDSVRVIQQKWNSLQGKIDDERFEHVKSLLNIQLRDAIEWRNACILYFQTFSKMPIPEDLEKPDQTLEYYMKVNRLFMPGI
jgi:alpha-glucuronidase